MENISKLLVAFRFLSYFKTITGVKNFELKGKYDTIMDALVGIADVFPELRELILDEVPEVTFIMGSKNLIIPKDLKLPITGEIIIGPIVAGGSLILS